MILDYDEELEDANLIISNVSVTETSDITSVCSLSASAGAEAESNNLQNQQTIEKWVY